MAKVRVVASTIGAPGMLEKVCELPRLPVAGEGISYGKAGIGVVQMVSHECDVNDEGYLMTAMVHVEYADYERIFEELRGLGFVECERLVV